MRRIQVFLLVLIITLVSLSLLAIVSWYLAISAPSNYPSSWMSQMWGSHLGGNSSYGMGGMMGNGYGTTSATPSYLWIIPVALGVVVAIGVIGVAFYYAYPELKYIKGTCDTTPAKTEIGTKSFNGTEALTSSSNLQEVSTNCSILLKTMTADEKKVMDVLIAHQGNYLQKYIVKEVGFTRLKTHRIIARFAQRGIVTVKEHGNTNEVQLNDWVINSKD